MATKLALSNELK